MPVKKVIINADDFGLCSGINTGVIKAYQQGILSSASLLINMPGFEDAVDLIKKNTGLGIGVHINIMRGKAILSPDKVGSFTKEGCFLNNIFKIIGIILSGKLKLKHLEAECRAQIEKALTAGINITHLDSEKHLHLLSPVFEILARIARDYGISRIRYINEMPYLSGNLLPQRHIFNKEFYKILLVHLASIPHRSAIRRHGLRAAHYFYGASVSGGLTVDKYKKLFLSLRDGVTEIMCHPGYVDSEWSSPPLCFENYYLNAYREQELSALLEPGLKELMRELNINLISHREL